jgi:TetR/AcrR family transcriptional regulator
VSPESGSSRSTSRSRGRTAPIYKRLPCGPHSLDARDVSLHQRARIHGAMVEAVSRSGYERVSVKDVISLAAVSRRSFYEQFANREDCFLATIDLAAGRLLERVRLAHRESQGDPRDRLAAALASLAGIAVAERNATLLVLDHSETAGIAGRQRLLGAIARGEAMLASALRECTAEPVFPTPAVRAIAGGICAILTMRLQEDESSALASELTEWTLAQIAPRAAEVPAQLAGLLRRRMHHRAMAGPVECAVSLGERERLLDSALRAAGQRRDGQLSAIEIADGADIPIEAFFELFEDGPHCLRVAFAEAGRETVEIAARAGGPAAESPQAIRIELAALLEHLAAHPERAQGLTGAALCRVEEPRRQSRELAGLLGSALPLGSDAPDYLRQATVGALGHTVRVHQTQERVELLPAVADQLAYVALAPLLGAEHAIEALTSPG